jgi:hypothetical protein
MQPQHDSKKVKILCVYAASQTYTSTVFEHLEGFRKYSRYDWSFVDIRLFNNRIINLEPIDAVVLHYSVRLPLGQVSDAAKKALREFSRLKVLFIQDEYDFTNLTKELISSIGFGLVFSVVPEHSLSCIYPPNDFPMTRFVGNFTGYVPDGLAEQIECSITPSKRPLTVAYRGRSLPLRYGRLAQQKVAIGREVKAYCLRQGITCDIEWDESSRIYGDAWYRFIGSARAMLGTESGSNVFDWSGTLERDISRYRRANPRSSDEEIYDAVVVEREIDGLMNQLSPRVFEMAAAKTVMVLIEGAYSGVLTPHIHFLPLKEDFSNLDEVFIMLNDDQATDAMAERTYEDIILSGQYSYRNYVGMVDEAIQGQLSKLGWPVQNERQAFSPVPAGITFAPLRARPPLPATGLRILTRFVGWMLIVIWQRLPIRVRPHIKRVLGRI